MKILMVLTSHDKLGNTGRKTGFWLEEFAAPYFTFKDAGAEMTIASPKGGQPPLDPKSNEPNFQTDLTHRFEADADAQARLATTVRLDSIKAEDFDTVFYPGGHGPMWDLAEDQNSVRLLETMVRAGKTVALVCHAPGVLRHVKAPDGKPLVQGKTVTGFTNGEEEEVGLTKVVPFHQEAAPHAHYVPRHGEVNAWDNEAFVKAVRDTGKKTLIMAGVWTSVCVMFPALDA